MKSRIRLSLLAIMVFMGSSLMAYDGFGPGHKHFDLQTQVFGMINQYWLVQDLYAKLCSSHTPADEAKFNAAADLYKKQSIDMGKKIVAQLEDPNREVVSVISDIYKSLDPISRTSLYPALGYLKSEVALELRSPLSEQEFREYFPGYGYTEPGFKYRKGREVGRENKGVTWQSEEHSITTTFSVELTVTIDLLGILQGMVKNGTIKNLVVGEQFETNVNGTPMFVVKVSFQVIKAIVTKTNRKFEVNKIWFELLRAKDNGWGNTGPWEPVGKTYEIINEPTGEEVVVNVSQG